MKIFKLVLTGYCNNNEIPSLIHSIETAFFELLSFNYIIFLIFFLNLVTQYYWGYTRGGIDFHTTTRASEGMSHTLSWVLHLLLALFFFCFPKKILWTCARSHGTHILALLFFVKFISYSSLFPMYFILVWFTYYCFLKG